MERDEKHFDIDMSDADFNSHAHVERDETVSGPTIRLAISTHTLTWSVTQRFNLLDKQIHFNSHAHVERDL